MHLINLLKKCKISGSLISGFQKTGIFPFDPQTILDTIPETSAVAAKNGQENQDPALNIDVVIPAFAAKFMANVEKHKRKVKDVRLDTTYGKILNGTEFGDALARRRPIQKRRKL